MLNYETHRTVLDLCLSFLEAIVDFMEEFFGARTIEVFPKVSLCVCVCVCVCVCEDVIVSIGVYMAG